MDLESFNEVAPLRWHLLSAEYLQREIPLVIQRSQENLRVIESVKMSDVTFGNIIEALEVATNPLDGLWGQVCHLETVANDAAFRKIYNEYLGIVVEFHGSIVLNEAIWERVRAVHSQDRNRLNTIQRRLLDETYQSFHDCGADLPEEKKLRLKEVRKQLAEKTQKYSENVLDSTETWEKIIPEKDRSLLDGLPETILGILREDAFRKGHADAYRVTLHAPVYGPIMRYVRCDSLRQELWLAYSKIAYDAPYGNEGLIREILALREEKARLLGKKNFADYVLQRRMAKNGATALRFTRELHGKVLPFFQRDVAQLEIFRTEILKKPIGRLDPWEVSYLSELQCQKLYAFDEEQLRPYFEMKVVLEGIFSIFRRLYGISFCAKKTTISPREGCEDVPVWHESVQYYEVYEKDGRLLGAFYLDLYPRLGKRSGAWVANQLRQGYYRRTNGQWITPIGFVGANLTPPTNEQPSLLTHYEVETLLHEFGHLMHHLMSGVEYASLGGVNVAWDFVELPSQIMENWAWEWDVLSSFAKHYQSGAPLPREIYQKMIHARNHNISIAFMRQLSLQKMDLDLHCSYDGSPLDAFIEKAIDGYVIQYSCKLLSLIRHFTHLFGDTTGYAAAYYSYKWAEVLDADAFTRFQRKGIFNPAVARIFRHRILEQGNREPPQVLFRQFMGRNPCVDALLFRYGLH